MMHGLSLERASQNHLDSASRDSCALLCKRTLWPILIVMHIYARTEWQQNYEFQDLLTQLNIFLYCLLPVANGRQKETDL